MKTRTSLLLTIIMALGMGCEGIEEGDLEREAEGYNQTIGVMFNHPDCVCPVSRPNCLECKDPSGGIKPGIVTMLGKARATVDFAIYGLDDPDILKALCETAKRDSVLGGKIQVRVVGDDESMQRCVRQEQALPITLAKATPYTRTFVLWSAHKGFKVKVDAIKGADNKRRRSQIIVEWTDSRGPQRQQSNALATSDVTVSGLALTEDTPFKVTVLHADNDLANNAASFSFLPLAGLEGGFCDSRSYYASFEYLQSCGAKVEFVVSQGIMHNKFYLIDAGASLCEGLTKSSCTSGESGKYCTWGRRPLDFLSSDQCIHKTVFSPYVITGSANQTTFCITKNHNHMLVLQNPPAGLVKSYQNEFEQYFQHCRQNGRTDCTERTPGCMLDKSEHGPFAFRNGSGGSSELSLYFAPTTKARPIDALEILRGRMKEKDNLSWTGTDPKKVVPEACKRGDSNCTCQVKQKAREEDPDLFKCYFCAGTSFDSAALDDKGWGLMSEATKRLLVSIYAGTDPCFALGLGKVGQGYDLKTGLKRSTVPETASLWNQVEAGSPYTRDDQVCAAGVPVYITNWGPIDPSCGSLTGTAWREKCMGDSVVRNHNKIIVVDDVIFDGSMNISASGNEQNNENVIVIRDKKLADRFADYIRSEVKLLESRGIRRSVPAACACKDLNDNDFDGVVDKAETSCSPCFNGLDDDGDGLIDNKDPDCDLGNSASSTQG